MSACHGCSGDLVGIGPAHGTAGTDAMAGIASGTLAGKTPREHDPRATVFSNGTILAMDDRLTQPAAIAIAAGKIVAAGSLDDALASAGPDPQRVDLDGRTLMPGLIDPHQHPVPGGLMLTQTLSVSYDRYKSKAEVLDVLIAKAAATPAGQWIYASYYDNLLHGGYLTMAELDAVSTQHPIFVYYVSMHTATGNRLAFDAAGVEPSVRELPGGGYFGVDAAGAHNGMIFEMPALLKFLRGFPKLTPELVGAAIMKFLYQSAALGVTMVHEAGSLAQKAAAYEGYRTVTAHSPVRLSVSPIVDYFDGALEFLKPYGTPTVRAVQIPGALLSFYAVKIVLDGSPQQQTAYQSLPYLGSESRGNPNYTAERLNELVAQVAAAGWTISIHCNGDASLDMALDAIEAAYGSQPPSGINRIEHCAMTRPEQIGRMKRLGVQPSHLMNNVYYYGSAYRDAIFGPERAARFNAAGDFYRNGVPFTIHSDCPCSPVAPLREIGTAVTRRCSIDGSVVGADQAVPIEAALRAMTSAAARQCGLGDKLGSLEAGKYADLAIFERDPRSADPDKLGDIRASETWVDGHRVLLPG
ncbi:MAG TPA: amidohydrolase [Verrucomicrobiae bacterium]|nr:amidohydrolase [Verrucomicrobiae bacterium]